MELEEKFRLIAAAVLFAGVLAVASQAYAYKNMENELAPWYGPMISQDEIAAAMWADENLAHWQLFSADLFACEMLTAVARQYCSVGGAWELADNANQRFADNEKVFTTPSALEAWQLSKKYGVKYVLVEARQSFYGYGYKLPNAGKFSDTKYFRLIHRVGRASVYEVVGA